ncbi:MAG: type II toxin-antitoxin system RelE/ParE family toxin [Terricaulis sp.]|nr:type II toxin-antitoxin system RelE/ParE family toxin [Terricaulis sp.]
MSGFRLSRLAEADLEAIEEYIARGNPARAISFIEELLTLCRRIGEAPLGYPARPDIAPTARMGVHGRYLVLFEITTSGVVIRRIVHGARRIEDLF